MAEYPAIDIWRYMLSEGVSIEYIKECVEKHIEGLLVILPRTDKVDKVIEDCRTFLKELNK